MVWKDGFFKRNPALKYVLFGASALFAAVVLALTFGPDETREFAHDVAEKIGIVSPEPTSEGVPE